MSSKATIAVGSIVSYAAATEVSGTYGKKLGLEYEDVNQNFTVSK